MHNKNIYQTKFICSYCAHPLYFIPYIKNCTYWGDSTIRDTPKLFLTHTGNLIPPSDRACGTIIMKKKFQILEITKKTKFSSRKSKADFFSQGLNFTVAKFCLIHLKECSFAWCAKLFL